MFSKKSRKLKIFKKRNLKTQFDGWISEHNSSLYKQAFWMTGNRDTAMDAVQETFYRAWLSIDKLNDTEKVFPWLLTILRRAVYREQRCQYRHAEVVNQLMELQTDTSASDAYSSLAIYDMLESVSMKHREIFLLFHLHGFSYEEIGENLQIPKGTVMSRLARAREALQKLDQESESKVIDLNLIKRGKRHEA